MCSRACATVRPAGSDLERPSSITVTEAPRSSSPPSARAIRVAVSHSSSHARRVSRSLPVVAGGVRRRPRVASRGWWSLVELVGARSNDPHASEVRSVPNYYKQQTAGKLHLLRAAPLLWGLVPSSKRIRHKLRGARRPFPPHSQLSTPLQSDGAWAVPDDLGRRSLATRLWHAVGAGGHSDQLRSSSTTIRSACRTQ
jgi:hypothetical protein